MTSLINTIQKTFYYVENRNGILRKNRGEGFEKSYVPLHGGQKLPKSSLGNNDWPIIQQYNTRTHTHLRYLLIPLVTNHHAMWPAKVVQKLKWGHSSAV